MTRFQLIAIRLALLALVLTAWEMLPRNNVINPLLLPPFGDVLTTLFQLLGRPQVHEAILVTSAEVIVAFVIAVPLGAAIGVLIAEIDEIPASIAEAELDGNILKLSKDGAMEKDWMVLALDMARLIGMTDLAPVEDIYTTQFRPVPTMV